MLNKKQKILIIVTILLLVISFVVPPWGDYFPLDLAAENESMVVFIGYSSIFNKPQYYLHEFHEETMYVKHEKDLTTQSNPFSSVLEIDSTVLSYYLSGNDSAMVAYHDSLHAIYSSPKSKTPRPIIFTIPKFDPADFPSKTVRKLRQLTEINSFLDQIPEEFDSLKSDQHLLKALAILQTRGEPLLTSTQKEYLITAAEALPQLREVFSIPLRQVVHNVNNDLIGFAGIYHELLMIQLILIILISVALVFVIRK